MDTSFYGASIQAQPKGSLKKISGSSLSCLYTSSGDGFDSNGDLTISGGTVVVWIANTADDQPLDADGTLTVSGGTILAAGGSAGMGVSTSATQPYVIFGSIGGMGRGPMGGSTSALAAKGSSFSIQDSSGSTVYSGTALCSANYVFFSSSKLSADASYTLCSGSTSAATATAQTGTASGDLPGGMGGQCPGSSDGQTPPSRPPSAPSPAPL